MRARAFKPWELKGFRKKFEKLCSWNPTRADYEDMRDEGQSFQEYKLECKNIAHEIADIRISPDAHCFVDGVLYALEIVESNDLDNRKTWAYDTCWSEAGEDWDFSLLIHYPKQHYTLIVDDFCSLVHGCVRLGGEHKAVQALFNIARKIDQPSAA